MKRFRVLEIGGIKKLVTQSEIDDIKYYLPVDELYDMTIESAHVAIGMRSLAETSRKYANVTKELYPFFCLCAKCVNKRKLRK